ncbi:hypothetical protein NX059_000431 [Plenodomus lindquistii]|nr:hypothetical protein NX059_000431 [Plenodomus lindquistii]
MTVRLHARLITLARLSVTFKGEIMSWSVHMGEACNLLQKEGEQSDSNLVAMAKLARVIVNAADVARRALYDDDAGQNAMLAIAPLKLSFEQTKATLTSAQLQHSSIIAYLHTAETSILELAFHTSSTLSTNPSFQSTQSMELSRISSLNSLLQSCASCVTVFLSIDMVSMTTTCMLIYAYSLRLLYRLSTPNDAVPGWDPQIARDTISIGACVEHAAQKVESTNARLREDLGEDSMFAAAAKIMRATAGNWALPGEVQSDGMEDEGWSSSVDLAMVDFSNDFWLSTLNF